MFKPKEMSVMKQTSPKRFPKMSYVGIDGVLIRFGAEMSEAVNAAALAFHQHISRASIDGVLESAPSLTAVYLRLDIETDPVALLGVITQELEAQDWFAIKREHARRWVIPCSFDGPQLAEAAKLAGVSEAQAVKQITETELRVFTLGFAPGQPYLGSLEPHWNIPRMDGVAPNVPAQALVVAVAQVIIFANAAPTGWRHIGQTAFRCFDQERSEAFAFQAGDLVQFQSAARSEIDALTGESFGGARLEVLS